MPEKRPHISGLRAARTAGGWPPKRLPAGRCAGRLRLGGASLVTALLYPPCTFVLRNPSEHGICCTREGNPFANFAHKCRTPRFRCRMGKDVTLLGIIAHSGPHGGEFWSAAFAFFIVTHLFFSSLVNEGFPGNVYYSILQPEKSCIPRLLS